MPYFKLTALSRKSKKNDSLDLESLFQTIRNPPRTREPGESTEDGDTENSSAERETESSVPAVSSPSREEIFSETETSSPQIAAGLRERRESKFPFDGNTETAADIGSIAEYARKQLCFLRKMHDLLKVSANENYYL